MLVFSSSCIPALIPALTIVLRSCGEYSLLSVLVGREYFLEYPAAARFIAALSVVGVYGDGMLVRVLVPASFVSVGVAGLMIGVLVFWLPVSGLVFAIILSLAFSPVVMPFLVLGILFCFFRAFAYSEIPILTPCLAQSGRKDFVAWVDMENGSSCVFIVFATRSSFAGVFCPFSHRFPLPPFFLFGPVVADLDLRPSVSSLHASRIVRSLSLILPASLRFSSRLFCLLCHSSMISINAV